MSPAKDLWELSLYMLLLLRLWMMVSRWHSHQEMSSLGLPLVVQWLRLCTHNAGGPGSSPGQGNRSHMLQLKNPVCCNEDWRSHMLQLRPGAAKKKKKKCQTWVSGYIELDLVSEKGKDWNETCPLSQGQDRGEETHLMKRTVLLSNYESKETLKIQPRGRISQRHARRKPPVFPNNPCSCMSPFHTHYLEHPSYLCLLCSFILHNQVVMSPPLQS